MRSQVKICGELFDIDQVEGGKLRASSIKLPGFELVEASHNLLRMRMQKALAEYDRQTLLGVNTQASRNRTAFTRMLKIDLFQQINDKRG